MNHCVLIVENQHLTATILADLWKKAGAEVVGIVRKKGDVEPFLKDNPHITLVSLDLNLPDGSAVALLENKVFGDRTIVVITDDLRAGTSRILSDHKNCRYLISKDEADINVERFSRIIAEINQENPPEPIPAQKSEMELKLAQLSPLQVRILRAHGCGLSRKEISARIGLSESAIKWHLNQIAHRLDLSIADLVNAAIQHGIVRIDSELS